MKKTLAVFGLIFGLLCFYVGSNFSRINSDIFSLISIENSEILSSLSSNANSHISILAHDEATLQKLETFNQEHKIFTKIFYKISDIAEFQDELKRLRLALFKGELDEKFFQDALFSIYSPLPTRALSVSDDPLDLASYASVLNPSTNVRLDPKTGLLKAGEFVYASAILRKNFSDDDLLNAYILLKNDGAIVSGGAIFGAFGKANGMRESTILGAVGTTLCLIFLFGCFKNLRIFLIFLAPFFGFVCGLAACFALLGGIHALSIVIATSLVGLMLDFACGWLALCKSERLQAKSIVRVRGIFAITLVITCGGYALFLLSPMQFLHQIAVFSIFGLIGAFGASYFCLPVLLQGVKFNQSGLCRLALGVCERAGSLINTAFIRAKFAFFALIGVSIFVFFLAPFEDNVRNYASSDALLLEDAKKIAQTTRISSQMSVIKAPIARHMIISQALSEQNISASSIATLVNSEPEQEMLKCKFADLAHDEVLLSMFEDLDVSSFLSDLANLPTLSMDELKGMKLLENFAIFFDYPQFLFVQNTNFDLKNPKIFEILAQNDAQIYDLTTMINENFTTIKANALWLKLAGFVLAFVVLAASFGLQKGALVSVVSFGVAAVSVAIFAVFSDVNIFVVFGVILASAIGIDYLVFALKQASARDKIFGIFSAGITSMITFGVLGLSATHAVCSFGLAVVLATGLNMLCAFALCARE